MIGNGAGHTQSVIFAALCLILGAIMLMMGFLADLIATNRKLMERIHLRLQRVELAVEQRRQGH